MLCETRDFNGSNDATVTRTSKKKKKKAIGFISKTTTWHVHHTFSYIYILFLHDYDVELPNFAFYGDHQQITTKFISLSGLGYGRLEINISRVRLHLKK